MLSEALSRGGSYCDLYFEDTVLTSLLLREGQVNSCAHTRDCGCGIRVVDGDRTGYACSESFDLASLLKAARSASMISQSGEQAKQIGSFAKLPSTNFYPMRSDWRECETGNFVEGLVRLEKLIRSRETRTFKVMASLSYSVTSLAMYNSLGQYCTDLRPMCTLGVSVVYRQGTRIENKSISRSYRMGAEFFTPALIEEAAALVTSGVDALFEAGRPKGGKMNVVMGAGASGILLHEAMGHAFEADFNRKGQSIFSDMMGKRVCRKGINIVDDGTRPFDRGALNFDDELVPGQKTYMVTDGILTSFLHDRISAKYYGVAPTGNGRRENFRYNPIPRMRCTYMESGDGGTKEDLIALAGNGIYVDDFSNGEVKIGQGDFTFYVKSGYLIENGRLTKPVKDVNIIGNGPQALANIEAVGSDLKIDPLGWVCGKGQSVPVGCGIPSVLIRNLTVGGE